MPLDNAPAGAGHVPEYLISGIPYVTSSIIAASVSGSIQMIQFPTVSREVVIKNNTASTEISVGFSSNGLTKTGNYFTVDGGDSVTLPIRVVDLYISNSLGASIAYEVIGSLTTIERRNFPVLTGTNPLTATAGVG